MFLRYAGKPGAVASKAERMHLRGCHQTKCWGGGRKNQRFSVSVTNIWHGGISNCLEKRGQGASGAAQKAWQGCSRSFVFGLVLLVTRAQGSRFSDCIIWFNHTSPNETVNGFTGKPCSVGSLRDGRTASPSWYAHPVFHLLSVPAQICAACRIKQAMARLFWD